MVTSAGKLYMLSNRKACAGMLGDRLGSISYNSVAPYSFDTSSRLALDACSLLKLLL